MAERDDIFEDTAVESELVTERGRSPLFKGIAILSALAIAGLILLGFMMLLGRNYRLQKQAEQERAAKESQANPSKAPALAEVLEDEALPKGTQSIIAGTVRNISNEPLTDLSVDIELIRRSNGAQETRTIALEPKNLAPGEQGRYSLTIVSHDFRVARLIKLKSAVRPTEISFKLSKGTRYPYKRPEPKTIVVDEPGKRDGNGDFINTPDNPTKIK